MADAVNTHASLREYSRHQRHSQGYAANGNNRLRHGQQELAWLNEQATRLSTTSELIWDALDEYTAEQIEAATEASQIGIS